MSKVLLDSFSSFQSHLWMVICILLIVIWGQIVIQKFLLKIFVNSLTDTEYFSLSFTGWIFPVFCLSIIYFLANFLFGKTFGIILSALLLIPPFFWIRFKKPSMLVVILILFLLVSIFVRFAFLQQALLPSYFDSPFHYQYIQNILNIYENKSVDMFLPIYYHFGYHFLSVALIHLFQFNITDFMLVFGQVILAILPISSFFLLKQMTGSNTVAFFTCLVAGFGFHMPAHLINWGKYPALFSLMGIQFVLGLGYFVVYEGLAQRQKIKLYWLIAFSIIVTTLIHTRAPIVFVLFTLAHLFSLWQKQLSIRFQYLIFGLILFIIAIEVFYIQRSPVLFPLVERYAQNDIWILILVLCLMPFSLKMYSNLTFFLVVSIAFFIFPLFFPIRLLDYGTLTLLDRPYVQMLLYLPLSMLTGLGFAGFMQMIRSFTNSQIWLSAFYFLLFGFLLLNIKLNQNFYPAECCNLVSKDDLSAIEWMEINTPTDAKILIPTSQLYVTSYESTTAQAPVDAGVWLRLLTSRETSAGSSEMNFETIEVHTEVCSRDVDYIYLGSMPQSFKQSQLASQPNWYQPVFLLPKAQVYQVVGCD